MIKAIKVSSMPRTDFRMPCVLAMLPVWGLVGGKPGERLARIQRHAKLL